MLKYSNVGKLEGDDYLTQVEKEKAMNKKKDSTNMVSILEAFLACRPEEVVVPLTTDGEVLKSYGRIIARWKDGKIIVVSSESMSDVGSRMIKRHIIWVTTMAQARGMLFNETQ